MWERYCRGVQAIVFVVDSADLDSLVSLCGHLKYTWLHLARKLKGRRHVCGGQGWSKQPCGRVPASCSCLNARPLQDSSPGQHHVPTPLVPTAR